MYKLHLILKYLRKRRIAWVSLIAVTLCTAMVLVVISVMGGWLRMFRESFHGLTGDIIVHGESLSGFPHYQEMIDRIEQLPGVRAAVPTIETFGLVNIKGVSTRGVQVVGYPIERIGLVNNFPRSLYRQYQQMLDLADNPKAQMTREQRELLRQSAETAATQPSFRLPLSPDDYRAYAPPKARNPETWPGMIVGIGVVGIQKDKAGNWPERGGLHSAWVYLTVMGVSGETVKVDVQGDATQRPFWIVDDSRTQIWQADQANVYVPFDVLQKMLGMEDHQEVNPDTSAVTQVPARTRDIQISARPGVDIYELKPRIQAIIDEVMAAHDEARWIRYPIAVETWEESQATFIAAIEKEKMLVTMLFALISIVAVFLIFCIFYMIVVEKTRDIGIVKSVGATNAGVAGIFLGYGLAIGIVGSALGLLFGWLIVHYINELHAWMGRAFHVQIWNPEVYAFDTIPNTMDPKEVSVILAVALISAVLGALLPAVRAAQMHPVEALRWE